MDYKGHSQLSLNHINNHTSHAVKGSVIFLTQVLYLDKPELKIFAASGAANYR